MHPHIHAARTPEKPAIVMSASGRTLTYRELRFMERGEAKPGQLG
jgi:hypothetical protein